MVLAVDVSDDREGTRQFYEEGGFVVPAAFDTEGVALRDYRIPGTPTNYLLDGEGRILWRRFGFRAGDEAVLEETVVEALGQLP